MKLEYRVWDADQLNEQTLIKSCWKIDFRCFFKKECPWPKIRVNLSIVHYFISKSDLNAIDSGVTVTTTISINLENSNDFDAVTLSGSISYKVRPLPKNQITYYEGPFNVFKC